MLTRGCVRQCGACSSNHSENRTGWWSRLRRANLLFPRDGADLWARSACVWCGAARMSNHSENRDGGGLGIQTPVQPQISADPRHDDVLNQSENRDCGGGLMIVCFNHNSDMIRMRACGRVRARACGRCRHVTSNH
jgi:hypothetical protein